MLLMRSRSVGVGLLIVVVGVAVTILGGIVRSSQQQAERVARAVTGGDPARAPDIMRRYGCGGCHTIKGLAGADGQVGPPLSGLIHRVYVGGANNSSDSLITWIVSPQSFAPRTAMPATGITEGEARDVAAWLYTQ
jgi:cytochrome c2